MNLNTTFGPGDSSDAQGDIKERTDSHAAQLAIGYWQDMEVISDAFCDVGSEEGHYREKTWYTKHGLPIPSNYSREPSTLLKLLRNGSDDLEAMRIIRKAMERYIAQLAEDQAQEQAA